MIRIERAPAYASIQDQGRRGFLDSGVPRAGAMDRLTLETLNGMLGNDPAAAGIEWALSGGELVFEAAASFAIGGADANAVLDGRMLENWKAYQAQPGQRLSIGAPAGGRFMYVAFAGGITTPLVLGSRSTYAPAEIGGLHGRRLRSGDSLPVGTVRSRRRHQVSEPLPENLRPSFTGDVVRYVPAGSFAGLEAEWIVSPASDRTGYRLESSANLGGDSIVSEPVCPGTIQIPPGGQPIVLMADAPTIGGYSIAGCVISVDIGILAQKIPGETVQLEATSVTSAQRALRSLAERLEDVRRWSLI